MKSKIFLQFVIMLMSYSVIFSQENQQSDKSKLYNELINIEISPLNQKEKIKLKDHEDKTIAVVLFATWSGPCVHLMKNLVSLKEELEKEKFLLIGLNADEEDKEDFEIFLETHEFNFPIAFAQEGLFGSVLKVSKFNAIPQTIILHNKEVRDIHLGSGKRGVEKLKNQLRDLVKKKSSMDKPVNVANQ